MTYKSINNDSGISGVIGVILITAIVVAASAIVYTVVGAYDLEQPVIANIDIESIDLSNEEVVLVHRGGDSFNVSDISIIISMNGALGQNHLTFINMLISVRGNVIVIWFKCHCNFIPYGVFLRPTFFL